MANDPFSDGKSGDLMPGFPYDLNSTPEQTDPLNSWLHQVFDDNGWRTWGDFADERWVHTRDAYYPDELRPDMSFYLTDLIIQYDDIGIVGFTDFYYTSDDNAYHVLIPEKTP
jgi:hypothetical protein